MGLVTRRPDPAKPSSKGNWTMTPSTGTTVADILADDSDLTYMSITTNSTLPQNLAKFDMVDLTTSDVPDGAKIKSYTIRAKVFQVAPAGGSSFLSALIRLVLQVAEEVQDLSQTGDLGDFITDVIRHVASFPVPTPPGSASPTWQFLSKTYTALPSGVEATIASINALSFHLSRSDSNSTQIKISEYYLDVEFNEAPVVTIIGPDPSTVTGTTRPIITISYEDVEGDPQAAVRFRIFTAAQAALGSFDVEVTPPFAKSPGTDDWIVGEATQWLCNRDLPNGDYVVYAQSKQQWNGPTPHVSQWDAYPFTIDVEGPAAPTLVATPDFANNWVQLNVTAPDNDPAVETYNIYSSDDAGITWQLVWGGWQIIADADGNATLIDHLAPLNQNRWYKALAYTTIGTIKVASDEDPTKYATAVPEYAEFALKDPFAPTLNQPIGWMDDEPGEDRAQGVHIPLVAQGLKAYAIVVDGPLQGITGDSKLLFVDPDDEAWEKWKAIRASGHTLLLQYPTGEQHWIRIKGQAKWSWRTDGATGVDYRILEWGYIEVQPPKDPTAPASVQGAQ